MNNFYVHMNKFLASRSTRSARASNTSLPEFCWPICMMRFFFSPPRNIFVYEF